MARRKAEAEVDTVTIPPIVMSGVTEVVLSPLGRVLERYTQLREDLANVRATAKTDEAAILNKMQAIEDKLHDVMREQGAEQLKAGGRTAYITVTVKPRVDDWPAFEAFVLETGDLSWLHRRPSEGVFKEYTEKNQTCPPGTTAVTAREVRIRNS